MITAAQKACDTADAAPISALCNRHVGLQLGALDVVFHDSPMNGVFDCLLPRSAVPSLGRQYGAWEKNVVIHRIAQILPLIKKVFETGMLPRPLHFSISDGGPANHVAFSSSGVQSFFQIATLYIPKDGESSSKSFGLSRRGLTGRTFLFGEDLVPGSVKSHRSFSSLGFASVSFRESRVALWE